MNSLSPLQLRFLDYVLWNSSVHYDVICIPLNKKGEFCSHESGDSQCTTAFERLWESLQLKKKLLIIFPKYIDHETLFVKISIAFSQNTVFHVAALKGLTESINQLGIHSITLFTSWDTEEILIIFLCYIPEHPHILKINFK